VIALRLALCAVAAAPVPIFIAVLTGDILTASWAFFLLMAAFAFIHFLTLWGEEPKERVKGEAAGAACRQGNGAGVKFGVRLILSTASWIAPVAILLAVFSGEFLWALGIFFLLTASIASASFLAVKIYGQPLAVPEPIWKWRRSMTKNERKSLIKMAVGVAATVFLFRIAEALFFG